MNGGMAGPAADGAGARTGGDELEALRATKRRATDLASTHLEALDVFYLARDLQSLTGLVEGPVRVGGFTNVVPPSDCPRDGTARASLASTAACVRSLMLSPQVKSGRADFGELLDIVTERYRVGDLSTYGLEHLNPFTVGQLLPVLRDVNGPDPAPSLTHLVADCADRLRQAVAENGVSIPHPGTDETSPRFSPHGYLTYWALVALDSWGLYDEEAVRPSLRWSEMELYRQIALFQSGHDERSDAYQLGYNLLVQYRFNRLRLGNSLIQLGLATLFGAQLERGVWEKRDPLFRYGDQGEAYCFSFELLTSLMRELRSEWSLLVPCEYHLARALEWAERNVMRHHGPPVWRSAHLVEEKMPESWATADVYSFLQLYAAYLSWRVQSIVQEEFRSEPSSAPNPRAFDNLYQPEVSRPKDGAVLLGDLLKERLLEPLRLPGDPAAYSLVRSTDPRGKARSGILFGPPGTGKTTYVRKVAEYLGWPLVVLDPSDFAQEGLPLIATVASRVFAQLMELEDTVIFFDEMEALMHSRTDAGGSFEQKFLTTSLLPKLQELADRAACLFFVATNHFDTIDRAAQRPGRFDFTLQIMPPSYEEKLRMASDVLGRDVFAMVEADLRRQPYRDNIRLASRSEMLSLLRELGGSPERAEETLSQFRAELVDDERFRGQPAETALGR